MHQPTGGGEPCPNCGQIHPDNSQAAEQPVSAGLKIGEPAPPVRLRDLKDKKVNLASFRGQKALVLFWNPGCGFCQQMLPELKEWEQNPPEGAPKLLVLSGGTKEANREMGLSSTVALETSSSPWGSHSGRAGRRRRCSSTRRGKWPPSCG